MQVPLGIARRAVSLIGSLADLEYPGGFAELVLPGLDQVVGSDVLTYNEVGPAAGQVHYTDYPAGTLAPATQKIFAAHVHEHPVINYYRVTGSGQAMKISDFLSQRQFHRLGLYAEFFRQIPVEHQIAISMLGPDGEIIGIALNRGRGNFTETERAVLGLLRGPLMAALARARNRQLAHSALRTTPPASLAALTDREIQVLELVALGHTNAAIAHMLDVSPRTIAKHLEHIYRKLGVASRAAAAARSAQQFDSLPNTTQQEQPPEQRRA
jgi:DNA-binding CsgD family transcriptional regulator